MKYLGVELDEARYLAIDPGEGGANGGTGWALFKGNGDLLGFGTCNGKEAVYDLLECLSYTPIEGIFMEDFKLYSWKAQQQSGSRFETVKVIGVVEYWAHGREIGVTLQSTQNRDIGYMWAGLDKAKAKKFSHERDAVAHGVYGLQKAGIRKPQQGRSKNNA